jgi:simple sugar transport system ATP-binding protein
MTTDETVAAARGVGKRYGSTVALADVSLEVRPASVHALVGRNGAGKSTLVSLLTGLQSPDSGSIEFNGHGAPPLADRAAWRGSVACVYQHLTIIPALSVAENLFINRQATSRGLIGWNAVRKQAESLLETWEVDVDVRRPAGELTIEQRQLVEIARALSYGSRFIILDEPTAQLDAQAIDRLFDRMRALQKQGVTFLFISHHLEEVYEVCDTVTVMRDARHILTAPVAGLPQSELVAAMTGDATALLAPPDDRQAPDPQAQPALRVTGLSLPGSFADIGFEVRPGEIVGLAGSTGSGKMALGECVVGMRAAASGRVEVGGRTPRPGSVPAAIAAGIGFVPQDRRREGFVPGLSIAENATMTVPHRLGRFGFISPRRQAELAARAIEDLTVVASGPGQPVSALSGGNQQKVVMARALADEPRALVLMQPTAGVDVRAKETLLGAARTAAGRGAAVLIISDDLDDLRPADRVLVLFKGSVTLEAQRGWRDNDLIAAMEGVSST